LQDKELQVVPAIAVMQERDGKTFAIGLDCVVKKRNSITWRALIGLACRICCYVRVAVRSETGAWANLTFMWPCIVINFL